MKTIRQFFTEKVETLQLTSPCYLEKTMNQLFEVSKEDREKLRKKMELIIKSNDVSFCQKVFNELSGLLNDFQLQAKHTKKVTYEDDYF